MCVCGGAHLHCTRALSSCQRSKKISFQLSITRFAISFWYRPICTPPPLFFDENKKTMHVSNDHSEWGVGVDVGGRAAPSPIQNCQQASTWRAKHWKEITCHKNQTHLNPSDNNKGIGTTKATPFRYIYSLGCYIYWDIKTCNCNTDACLYFDQRVKFPTWFESILSLLRAACSTFAQKIFHFCIVYNKGNHTQLLIIPLFETSMRVDFCTKLMEDFQMISIKRLFCIGLVQVAPNVFK